MTTFSKIGEQVEKEQAEAAAKETVDTKGKSIPNLIAIEVDGGPFGFGIDGWARKVGMETEFPPVQQGNVLYAACRALVDYVDATNLTAQKEGETVLRTQPENVETANAWIRDIQNRINVYQDAKGRDRFKSGDVAFLTIVTAIESYQIDKMKRRAAKKGLKKVAAMLGLTPSEADATVEKAIQRLTDSLKNKSKSENVDVNAEKTSE